MLCAFDTTLYLKLKQIYNPPAVERLTEDSIGHTSIWMLAYLLLTNITHLWYNFISINILKSINPYTMSILQIDH